MRQIDTDTNSLVRRIIRRPLPLKSILALVACSLMLVAATACSATGAGGASSGGAGGGTITVKPTPPPPFQTPGPLGAPEAGHGVPAIAPTTSGVPAFTTDDMSKYGLGHALPGTIGSGGTPSVSRDAFLKSQDLALLLGGPTGQPDETLLGYLEEKGDFTFGGPTPDSPLHFPYAFQVFDARSGNLLFWGGLDKPTPNTPPPTPTPAPSQQPTPTATTPPQPIVKFSASPTGFKQACDGTLGQLSTLKVTLDNTGSNVDVGYQVINIGTSPNGKEPWAAASPASGTVAAGKSASLTLTPVKDLCTQFKDGTPVSFTASIKLTSGGTGTTVISDSVTPFIIS
jgi:hypothetical protein